MRVNYHLGFSLFLVVLYSVVEVSGMLWDSFRDSFGGEGRGGEGRGVADRLLASCWVSRSRKRFHIHFCLNQLGILLCVCVCVFWKYANEGRLDTPSLDSFGWLSLCLHSCR